MFEYGDFNVDDLYEDSSEDAYYQFACDHLSELEEAGGWVYCPDCGRQVPA